MNSPKKTQPSVQGLEFAKKVADISYDNRAEDIVILDLRNLSSFADFFVIATGTSDRQMQAIVDRIEEYSNRIGQKRYGLSGYENSTWILVDYVDVVIHLFDAERRLYYDLELLWGDAPRINWQHPATA
ncbi:MAG: ribosome silencing factor [Planctomycetota bacterium]|jgi:ribosome-associated protein